MQAELSAEGHKIPIQIIGVDGIGLVGADHTCDGFCTDRTIPWLEDAADKNVWTLWGVTYRDVFVLDPENKSVKVYNLSVNNLADPAKYAELKNIIATLADQ